jgi:hypothetical protein
MKMIIVTATAVAAIVLAVWASQDKPPPPPLVTPGRDDREETPCLSALASGDACQPDESLKRCAICGFVVDVKFAAVAPTVRMRP